MKESLHQFPTPQVARSALTTARASRVASRYLRDLFGPLRIDHWHKNGFLLLGVLAALRSGGAPRPLAVASSVALCFLATCLMASANYALNEILDAPSDRWHPTKKHRPLAAGRVPVWQVAGLGAACGMASLLLAAYVNHPTMCLEAAFFVSGLVYNVPPVRAKDVAFVDVVVESFNNPLRLALGWVAVIPRATLPPVSLIVAFWSIGALLMSSKRFAEIRDIDSGLLVRYRKSFSGYSEESLHIAMVIYACLFAFGFGITTHKYAPDLLLMIPLILGFIGWFFHLSYAPDSIVKEPERLIANPWFLAYCLMVFIVLLGVLFGPPEVRHFAAGLANGL